MTGRLPKAYTTMISNVRPGINYWHITYEAKKRKAKRLGDPLRAPEEVRRLKEKTLPQFIRGIEDLTEQGFRVVVDFLPQTASPQTHIISGEKVSAQNPQDWLTPQAIWNPDGPAAFFEKCAEAAAEGAEKAPAPFGNKMLYAGREREVFGVMDGDPKSETHFLVLAARPFGNIMDAGFTADHMIKFFETAYQICEEMEIQDQHIRFVLNTGSGFQVGSRVHMHVQSAEEGLPSMFPKDYGFRVIEGGVIQAPRDSELRELIPSLISARQQIKGFSSHAAEVRRGFDLILLRQLEKIRALGLT